MKVLIPAIAAALLAGGVVGCDDTSTTKTETKTVRTTDTDRPHASGDVTVDGTAAKNSVKDTANDAADATKRGLDKTGDALNRAADKTGDALNTAADKTKDALTPDKKVEIKTETKTSTTPAQ